MMARIGMAAVRGTGQAVFHAGKSGIIPLWSTEKVLLYWMEAGTEAQNARPIRSALKEDWAHWLVGYPMWLALNHFFQATTPYGMTVAMSPDFEEKDDDDKFIFMNMHNRAEALYHWTDQEYENYHSKKSNAEKLDGKDFLDVLWQLDDEAREGGKAARLELNGHGHLAQFSVRGDTVNAEVLKTLRTNNTLILQGDDKLSLSLMGAELGAEFFRQNQGKNLVFLDDGTSKVFEILPDEVGESLEKIVGGKFMAISDGVNPLRFVRLEPMLLDAPKVPLGPEEKVTLIQRGDRIKVLRLNQLMEDDGKIRISTCLTGSTEEGKAFLEEMRQTFVPNGTVYGNLGLLTPDPEVLRQRPIVRVDRETGEVIESASGERAGRTVGNIVSYGMPAVESLPKVFLKRGTWKNSIWDEIEGRIYRVRKVDESTE